MDVLQIIGANPTRTPEKIEPLSSHEDDWADLMKSGEEVSERDLVSSEPVVLTEPVEFAVSVEGDVAPDMTQNVDTVGAVPDVSALPLTITISEHALNADWNDKGYATEDIDQELEPDDDKQADAFGLPSLNVQDHKVSFGLPQPVNLTNRVEETARNANLEDLKTRRISSDSGGVDDISLVVKVGQGELLGGSTGLITAKADPSIPTENSIDRPLLKMPLLQSEGKDVKVHDVSRKASPDLLMKLTQANQSEFAMVEEKAMLLPDGSAKIGEQVASIMNSSSAAPVMTSGQAVVASVSQTIRDQPIIAQVTQAFVSKDEGTIELRLDPAELGKVRITMVPRDGLMTITITAERPETLELLRRNADSLDAGFNDQGYAETQLDFQQSDGEDQSEEEMLNAKSNKIWDAPDTKSLQVVLGPPSDGLDIRI